MTACSETKICRKCNIEKPKSQFSKLSRASDGFHSRCKQCVYEYNNKNREENYDSYIRNRRLYYTLKKSEFNEKRRSRTKTEIELNHKAEYDKKYRRENESKLKQQKKEWEDRQKNNPLFKIKRNLRRRINHALKGKNKSSNTVTLLGCDIDKFKLYLESLWEDGMSWDNYGRHGWHIDHIRPCHSFDLSNESEQLSCFHYSNQRPLWATDNLKRTNTDYSQYIPKEDHPQ